MAERHGSAARLFDLGLLRRCGFFCSSPHQASSSGALLSEFRADFWRDAWWWTIEWRAFLLVLGFWVATCSFCCMWNSSFLLGFSVVVAAGGGGAAVLIVQVVPVGWSCTEMKKQDEWALWTQVAPNETLSCDVIHCAVEMVALTFHWTLFMQANGTHLFTLDKL